MVMSAIEKKKQVKGIGNFLMRQPSVVAEGLLPGATRMRILARPFPKRVAWNTCVSSCLSFLIHKLRVTVLAL